MRPNSPVRVDSSPDPRHGPSALTKFGDDNGCVHVGWVAKQVLFARFIGGLTSEVGGAYTHFLKTALEAVDSLSFFGDARQLTHYDLLARSSFVRVVLANRKKFSSLVLLTWPTEVSSTTRAFHAALGEPSELLSEPSEFQQRLRAAAPLARSLEL